MSSAKAIPGLTGSVSIRCQIIVRSNVQSWDGSPSTHKPIGRRNPHERSFRHRAFACDFDLLLHSEALCRTSALPQHSPSLPKSVSTRLLGPVLEKVSKPSVWRDFWFLPPVPSVSPGVATPRSPGRGLHLGSMSPNRHGACTASAATPPQRRRRSQGPSAGLGRAPHRRGDLALQPRLGGLSSVLARLVRAVRRVKKVGRSKPKPVPRPTDMVAFTAALKARPQNSASRRSVSRAYDEKYTFKSCIGNEFGDRIVVCTLEQNWEATQTIPSNRAEKSALVAYARPHRADDEARRVDPVTWVPGQAARRAGGERRPALRRSGGAGADGPQRPGPHARRRAPAAACSP